MSTLKNKAREKSASENKGLFLELKGDGVKGKALQYGSRALLVFNYINNEDIREEEFILGISVAPTTRGFNIVGNKDYEWHKKARIQKGRFLEPISFFLPVGEESVEDAGILVSLDFYGYIMYQCPLHFKITNDLNLAEEDCKVIMLDFDDEPLNLSEMIISVIESHGRTIEEYAK